MADDNDERKRDELKVMGLISGGKTKVNELRETLDWSRDRLEETLDDLKDSDYVETVQSGGDQVLAMTERGRDELPQLFGEVTKETRQYLESVSDSFQKHMSKVFPKVSFNVDIEGPEGAEGGPYACDECGKEFDSEQGLRIHSGMEH